MLREYLTNIANAIRAKLGTTDTINAQDFSAKVDDVYVAGKNAQYDEFWDSYKKNTITYCNCLFAGRGWNNESFKPNFNMTPTTARYMFFITAINDLAGALATLGISIDFSNCTNFENAFSSSYLTKIPVVDMSKATNTYAAFAYNGSLKTIEKIIVSETTPFSNTFTNCTKLENITIEGTIGTNGFNVASSTNLTKASITSIINALSDTTNGLKVTLSKTAVNKAFETSEGANDGSTSEEWSVLEATKTNWTISLA